MSEVETSEKDSATLTVEKRKIELEGQSSIDRYYEVLYDGNLRCLYDFLNWKAKLAVAGKGTIYGFTLQHQETGIETPIIWFE